MSCGGKGSGGTVSFAATEAGIPIAAARRVYHAEMSRLRRARLEGRWQVNDPTWEQVSGYLESRRAQVLAVRDEYPPPPDPAAPPPGDRWTRYQGYADNINDKLTAIRTNPGEKLPDAAEFSAWQRADDLMQQHADEHRCESCGRYAAEAGHTCPPPRATTPVEVMAAVSEAVPELRAHPSMAGAGAPAPPPLPPLSWGADAPEQVGDPALDDPPADVPDFRDLMRRADQRAFLAGYLYAQVTDAQHPTTAATATLPVAQPAPGVGRARAWVAAKLLGLSRCEKCQQWTSPVAAHTCPPTTAQDTSTSSTTSTSSDSEGTHADTESPSRGAQTAKKVAAGGSRFLTRGLLSPRMWTLVAPYALRAGLLAAPIIIFAGSPLLPFVAVATAVVGLRSLRWLKRTAPARNQRIIDHYTAPTIPQRIAARVRRARGRTDTTSTDATATATTEATEATEAGSSDAMPAARSKRTRTDTPPARLDLSTPAWSNTLAQAPVFVKSATVAARPARPGEVVTTTLADGTVETSNAAEEGDVLVTNPGGESYLVKGDVFRSRYRATQTPGVFQARGMVRAVRNPTGGPVTITAPWGEDMTGDENCWIVEAVNAAEPSARTTDRYVIGGREFADTYRAHAG